VKDLLVQLISGGLAGAAAWKLSEAIPARAKLEDDLKRYAAIAITVILGAGAYAASVGMRFDTAPADWRGWVEALVNAGMAAYLTSQSLHAATTLRLRREVKALKAHALRK